MTPAPIALSCGEPAGIGLELVEKSWQALNKELAYFVICDPAHLPGSVPAQIIADPAEARGVMPTALPVLPLAFDGAATPGTADPRNAAGVMDAIAMGAHMSSLAR